MEISMATLEQIQARMKRLQAQAEALLARRAQAAVDQIRSIMLKHGLTTADIEARAKARREARGAVATRPVKAISHKATANGKLPAKYRDPETGATWSGHARPPAWIKDAKDRTKFLIGGASEASGAGKPKGRGRMASLSDATTGAGKPKGKQPPKYQDPKTGATWSGRGPAPAWLASAKDRSRFLIGAAPDVARSASKKAAPAKKSAAGRKSAAGKRVVSKSASAKAASKPVASKKAASRKAIVAGKPAKRAIRSKASANGTSGAVSPVVATGQDSTT
jgi:DNA-binding protein H-NS